MPPRTHTHTLAAPPHTYNIRPGPVRLIVLMIIKRARHTSAHVIRSLKDQRGEKFKRGKVTREGKITREGRITREGKIQEGKITREGKKTREGNHTREGYNLREFVLTHVILAPGACGR